MLITFISQSHTKIQFVFPRTMIGFCSIVNTKNGAFKWCSFFYSSAPKHIWSPRHSCEAATKTVVYLKKKVDPSLVHIPGLLSQH